MEEGIRTKILTLLDQHRIMTVATLRPDGWPQATTVGYVNEGLTDDAILQSCFGMGHRPSEGEIHMWNEFMRKRGWNDELSGTLEKQKKKQAMLSRSEIQTVFQFIDADSGRLVNDNHTKALRIRKRVAIPAREWPSGQDTDNSGFSERVGSSRARRRTHHLARPVGSH